MKLLIPISLATRLAHILKRRGLTETGGILMGEQISPGEFRIVDFTVQRSRSTFSSFLRVPHHHRGPLERFFRLTNNDFRRFNYLGEWHSHPSFDVRPSGADVAAMREIVDDVATGATFAVLIIVRLREADTIEAGAFVFIPGAAAAFPISLVLEQRDEPEKCTGDGTPFLKHGERLLAKIGWVRNRRRPISAKVPADNEDADIERVDRGTNRENRAIMRARSSLEQQ